MKKTLRDTFKNNYIILLLSYYNTVITCGGEETGYMLAPGVYTAELFVRATWRSDLFDGAPAGASCSKVLLWNSARTKQLSVRHRVGTTQNSGELLFK